MAFSVIRSSRGLVTPFEQTPCTTLDLSIIDRSPVLRCKAQTIHVFKHGPEAARVIKEALSKALVPYYPLAGRLKVSPEHGQLQLECSGEGVWFVEASANCSLDSVNYLDDIPSIPCHELLPDNVPGTEAMEPLVQMQVTQFTCGGFVIGLIFSHTICDGLGAAQFLNAVGEIARGQENLSISPVWCRDFSPPPPPQQVNATLPMMPLLPPMPNFTLEHANIDIPMDQINQIKKEFRDLTGKFCSTFEVVVAAFWRCRTLAINLQQDTELNLVFFANCRQVLDPPLPEGFYGNCFFPVTVTVSSEVLLQASTPEVIKIIQQAKSNLPSEFAKYLKGDYQRNGGEDPFTSTPLSYTTLFVSEWGRLGFNKVDYGWGPPFRFVPIQSSSISPVGIVGSVPLPMKGIRLTTWCVEEPHLRPFLHRMTKFD